MQSHVFMQVSFIKEKKASNAFEFVAWMEMLKFGIFSVKKIPDLDGLLTEIVIIKINLLVYKLTIFPISFRLHLNAGILNHIDNIVLIQFRYPDKLYFIQGEC